MRAYRAAGVAACAIGMTVVLLAPKGAPAQQRQQDDQVDVYQAPSMSGSAVVGSILSAQGGAWRGPRGTRAKFEWWHCPSPSSYDGCREVADDAQQYQVSSSDESQYIFLVLAAWYGRDSDFAASQPSSRIEAPAPTPAATPTPTPTPDPGFDIAAPAATPVPNAGAVLQVTKRKAKLLRPFPVVRIRGRLSLTGARVTALTVKAPHRVKIVVTCGGPGCPAHRVRASGALTHVHAFERDLRAGLWLRLRITKRGYIGKQTVIHIRQGQAPLRSDGCVYPGHRKMQACPRG